MADWHGWSYHEGGPEAKAVYVGELPDRKSIALYTQEGAQCRVLAYFQDAEAAEKFMRWFDAFVKATYRQKVVGA